MEQKIALNASNFDSVLKGDRRVVLSGRSVLETILEGFLWVLKLMGTLSFWIDDFNEVFKILKNSPAPARGSRNSFFARKKNS